MPPEIVVIGAGVAGLSSAIDLAAQGCTVTVLERAAAPGGKMRLVPAGQSQVDGGPTVLTKRWVFEDLFEAAGDSFSARVPVARAEILARHVWDGDPTNRFDLLADREAATEEVARFSGSAEALRFRAFTERAQSIFNVLDHSFMRAQRPGPLELVRRIGPTRLADLMKIAPLQSMWGALGSHFRDPRLRQLFGRYATYCGSSPFSAPATLMLVAHVEQAGVWIVEGGMHRLAREMEALAERLGVRFRYDAHVAQIGVMNRKVDSVTLESGERFAADAVIHAGDAAALSAGLLGDAVRRAVPATPRKARSLSAMVWSVEAETSGFPLSHHNVFFSNDYAREFREVFRNRTTPTMPTTYVCAQDRPATEAEAPAGLERLQILVNAPPDGDEAKPSYQEIDRCEMTTFALLNRCGLKIRTTDGGRSLTTPATFNNLFPGTGGALYGRANHSPFATFQRPGAKTAVTGLYLASGSAHPGPGVPMAALSGRLAAARLLMDYASWKRPHRAAISGGMSTVSATTESPASP